MIPLTEISTIWHVGTLDTDQKTSRESLEGDLLSVSERPEKWLAIAKCGGETWEMTREGAQWLDALALDDEMIAEIEAWGVSHGLATRSETWRVWHYDSEMEEWRYMLFETEAEARAQEDGDPDEAYPSKDGRQTESVMGVVLTAAGVQAAGRWRDKTSGTEALIIVWADTVLKPENPDLMGVWWYEDEDVDALSCPRGGVFTDRLGEFKIESDRGQPPPESFTERYGAAETPEPA